MVGIAQLVRALLCGSRGHRFDSDYPPKIKGLRGCLVWPPPRHGGHSSVRIRVGPQNALIKISVQFKQLPYIVIW